MVATHVTDYVLLAVVVAFLLLGLSLAGRFVLCLVRGLRSANGVWVSVRAGFLNRNTAKRAIVCCGAYVVLSIAVALSHFAKETHVFTGLQAPEFSAVAMDGSEVSLAALRGKYVLLDFWDTACGPCLRDTPNHQALHDSYPDDLVIVAISSDSDRRKVERYVSENGLPWLQVLDDIDNNGDVAALYGITYLPTYIFIDRDGDIALTGIGVDEKLLKRGLAEGHTWSEMIGLALLQRS